jgi:hypothetical protein
MKKIFLTGALMISMFAQAFAQVGINADNSPPNSSAMLDVNSTSKGFLPPRMTMVQRDAITSPADGLMIYCIDATSQSNVQVYSGGKWYPIAFNRFPYATNVNQSGSSATYATLTGVFNYNDADLDPQGSSTFKWYRADNPSGLNETAISGATNQTYILTTNDTTKYVRFSVIPIAQTGASPGDEVKSTGFIGPVSPWICGFSPLVINHVVGDVAPVNKTVTYGTVTNIPGETTKCWITSNLGADHQAISVDDGAEASAGWYWQFNSKQGFKHDGTTPTPSWSITSINENFDWQPANDPCQLELGSQWRIPTDTEWSNVDNIGGWTDWTGPWNSGLKMHAAGYIIPQTGMLYARGSYGYGLYWSSTQGNPTLGGMMYFYFNFSFVNSNVKASGQSIRCLRE